MRLTHAQAIEFVEATLDCSIELQSSSILEAYLIDRSLDEVQLALDAFAHGLGVVLDPASVEITPDHLDDGDIPVVRLVIKTETN